MGKKKEVDQYGKTHSIWIDEWKPDAPAQAPASTKSRN